MAEDPRASAAHGAPLAALGKLQSCASLGRNALIAGGFRVVDFVPIGCYRLEQTNYARPTSELQLEGMQGADAGGAGGSAHVLAALHAAH